jgi:predicted nucleic acid-binding protein
VIVLDASAAIDWLLQTAAGHQIEKRIYSLNEFLATCVGLAESLRATLITRDLRLGSSSGHAAVVEVF